MREEFDAKTKRAEWLAANGRCRRCSKKIHAGDKHDFLDPDRVQYDHVKPAWLGGGGGPENCRLLCGACHAMKTGEEAAVRAKSNRVRNKVIKAERRKKRMPYRRFNGEIVWPD